MSALLGIDIGTTGAIALCDGDGALQEIENLPALPDGIKGRLAINGALLALMIRRLAPSLAFVEFVSSRPTDSKVSAFSFGRARGTVEGVLGACGVPIVWLTVPTWRRAVGLPPGASKDAARGEAIKRWPNFAASFARVQDADKAEAALIALAGLLRGPR